MMNATEIPTCGTVVSQDGTPITYSRTGHGPSVILVDAALGHREFGPSTPLAERLAGHFTVYTYDRRGRGESGDTQPYALEREIEDLRALVELAGEPVYLSGISSGAALALEAVNSGLPVRKLAMYENPAVVDDTRRPVRADYRVRLETLVAEGRRGAAVKLLMHEAAGMPAVLTHLFPLFPGWSKFKAVAHTLAYDAAVMRDTQHGKPLPADRWTAMTTPTLVIDGGKSPAWIRNAANAFTAAIPGAQSRTIPGQTHMVKPDALAPVLIEYFST